MSISFHRTVVFLSVTFVLTACESDTDKLQRLEGERAVQCLLAQKYEKDFLSFKKSSPAATAAATQWSLHDAKCQLATRELNRFMNR